MHRVIQEQSEWIASDHIDSFGKRFSECQIAILQTFYKKGMNGTGQVRTPSILAAAKKTGLSCQQVKVHYFAEHFFMSMNG